MIQELKRTIKVFANNEVELLDNLRLLKDKELPQEGECIFRILNREGDERIVWNRNSIPEINDAKRTFDDLVAKGMLPYKVGTNGRRSSEVMTEFDPYAEEVVFSPIGALVGG